MNFTSEVSLCISSVSLSTEEIGDRIGIPADRLIQKGSPRGKSPILKHAENVWILKSKSAPNDPLEMHVANLRKQLTGIEQRINALRPTCSIECSCVVTGGSEPPLNIPSDLVHWLGEIGASLDIDLYISVEGNQ